MQNYFSKGSVIAAVKDEKMLSMVCASHIEKVFLLFGNISDLPARVEQLKKNGKDVFIHVDLIEGLRADKEGLRFIAEFVKPYGIISTKTMVIRQANELGLKSVFRIFMIDASAYESGLKGIRSSSPTFVEVMPGLAFDVVRQLHKDVATPIIAGGMVKTVEQAENAFKNGATAISTSSLPVLKNNM